MPICMEDTHNPKCSSGIKGFKSHAETSSSILFLPGLSVTNMETSYLSQSYNKTKIVLIFFFLEYYSKIFVLNLLALLAFGSFFILTVLPNVPYRNFPRFQFFSSVVGRTLALASTLNCSGAVLEEFAVRGYWSPCYGLAYVCKHL